MIVSIPCPPLPITLAQFFPAMDTVRDAALARCRNASPGVVTVRFIKMRLVHGGNIALSAGSAGTLQCAPKGSGPLRGD